MRTSNPEPMKMTHIPVSKRVPTRPLACATLILALLLAAAPDATARQEGAAAAPGADPADVASIDAIIAALYDVISGPVGAERDWDRFRTLFVPGARMIPSGPAQAGGYGHNVLAPEDYIANSDAFLKEVGFREREIGRTMQVFGNIAHAFSVYEAFRRDETEPFVRGINSIQLFHDGARWWIVSVFWTSERPDNPIPERYITERGGTRQE